MKRALGYSIDTLQRRVCSWRVVSPRTTVGDSEFAGSIKLADSATVPVPPTRELFYLLVFLFSREGIPSSPHYIYFYDAILRT